MTRYRLADVHHPCSPALLASRGRALLLLVVGGALVLGAFTLWTLLARDPGGSNSRAEDLFPTYVSKVMPPAPGDRFVDATEEAGLDFVHILVDGEMSNIVESLGCGAAFIDYDNDGLLDIYFVQSSYLEGIAQGERPSGLPRNRLYRNQGDGTFQDVTDRSGVGDTGFGLAAIAADYDGDGHADLYLCNLGPNRLYRNSGNGTFKDVTDSAGVGDERLSVGASFLDYDGDSHLDLYVTNYLEFDPEYAYFYSPDVFPPPLAYEAVPDILYRNKGDGTFEDVSAKAGIASAKGRGMSVVTSDFDGDGRVDIFVSNDATANFLWRNTGEGTFEEAGVKFGLAFGENGDATGAMTADWGDYNRDGLMDLVVADTAYGSLYKSVRPGLFSDEVVPSGIAALSGQYVSWGGGFLDYDNDSDLDLMVINGDLHHVVGWEDLLLTNDGSQRFSDGGESSVYFRQKLMGRGGAVGDYDNDGDLDILITNILDRPVLLRNDSPAGNGWLRVTLEGTGGNRAAYGARVMVHLGERTLVSDLRCPSSYLCSGDPRLHIGLGDHEGPVRIEVAWPSGKRQVLQDVQPNQQVTIRESEA